MTVVIHLDTKDWIGLASGFYGKKPEFASIAKEVLRVSDNGEAIFPLSFIHLDETTLNQKPQQRARLAEFMTRVSKGWSILPASRIIESEIESACLKALGGQGSDLAKFAIRQNWFHMLGSSGTIVDKDPKNPTPHELKEFLIAKVKGVETLLQLMKWGVDKRFLRQRKADARYYIEETERIRKISARIKDKTLRHNVDLKNYCFTVVFPKIAQFLGEIRIDPETFASRVMIDEKTILKFLQSIPTAYCLFELDYFRNTQRARKIQFNDLNDMMSLAIALPYSDIVVTERMWRSRIVDRKLDKLRPTEVLSSAKDLLPILRKIG